MESTVLDRLSSRPTQSDVASRTSQDIDISNAGKTFPGGTVALDDVSLRIPAGEFVVLLGPSGCGKTTLLRCLAGLEPMTTGRIRIGDDDVTTAEPIDRGVAMVFQNYALYPDKTVAQNMAFPLRMARISRDERDRRVDEISHLLGIDQLLDRRPAQLSGGQKQRVGIGRALVRQPRLLLMDEPLSNLDAKLRVEMRVELLRLQRRLGMTVVYVTHDQAEALSLGDRLVVLREGRIEQIGTPDEVYQGPRTPFVAGFLGAMNLLPVTALDAQSNGTATNFGMNGWRLPETTGMVGLRPEDFRTSPSNGDQALSVTGSVSLVELLGRDRLLHVDTGQITIRATVPFDTHIDVGQEISLTYPATDMHHFPHEAVAV